MHPCSRCNFETRHYSKLLSHYRFVHSYEHGFFLTCCTDGCQRQYSNVDSFIKHIKRKHQAFFGIHLRKWSDSNRETGNLINLVEFHDEEHQVFGDELLENSAIDCKVNFSQKLGLFLLNLRERHKLPAVVIPKIVEEFKSMISHHQAQVSQSLLSTLSANDVTENGLIRLREIFQEQSDVELALNHLNSDHKLNKFAKQNLNFIQPIEYKADRTDRDTYQYVPILETLQSLLLKDDVFSHVMHGHQSVDEIMRDYCDGEHFKANPLFQNEPNALQIILFFDEFTAVNPIGHQVKNYKIGGFYMLLGNLPPKYRSQLYMIQLVILCLSPVIKKNGFQKVLEPLIHDLSVLETTGITISKSDGNYTFKGTVAAVVADNLGSHSIGGFLESFTTLRSCRFCFVSKQNMQTILNCDQVTPRTVDMYNEQLKLVERDQNLASVYGLKGCCPLNQLEYFHFIKGSPADLAHDLFEGVVCEVTKNVVAYCVARDFFTLEDLNDRLSSFEFSNVDKGNKPLKVSLNLRNLKIKQSAAQMWCFVRHLPLLVGMWVPDLDPKWEVLLQLRDVLLYVCAPALNRGHILVMKDLIEDFASSYRENFPDETLKPKFHYMIHYPHLMLNYGPLIHLQTIRFEGKHNYFKELVYRTKNKKNLCKSLALRHQYYQCTFNAGPNYLSGSNADSTGGSVVPLCLLKDTYQTLLQPVLHGEQEIEMEIERRFIVVSCLDRTKKVEMTEPITLDYVRSMVQNRFSVDYFDLQYFDNDVSEYIDLDSTAIADLRNSRIVKIKVIRVSASPTSPTMPVTPSTSESGNATLKNAETVNPQPSANNRLSSAAEAVAQTLTDEVNNPETTVATSNKTTKRRNWPKIYKLPKDVIPRGVLLKLEERLTISATDRRHFLDAIYNDVSRYEGGLYPTPDMYNEVVDSIFRDYPYLLKEGGISASSNRTFWKDKLVFKFGNSRKRIDASHPDVIQRKKAKVVSGPKTNADIQTERTWGLANFLPTSPITEDELSIDTHIKWLQREYRKTMDSDVTTVDMKMDLTFPHRRQKIISDKIALSEILEMYPWLQTRDQLLKEFARLKPNTTSLNLEDLLADNLKLYRYSVFQLIKGKKLPRYLQDMLSSHSQLQTEGQRHYAEDCICLLGLLVLFKESGDKLLSFRKADTPATTSGFKLVVQDNILTVDKSAFSLTIDGCDLFSCETFFELFSGMMAAIYTFNLAYPKPWERMLLFSQNILVGLKDSSGKLNKRILNVFTLIHNQMKSQ